MHLGRPWPRGGRAQPKWTCVHLLHFIILNLKNLPHSARLAVRHSPRSLGRPRRSWLLWVCGLGRPALGCECTAAVATQVCGMHGATGAESRSRRLWHMLTPRRASSCPLRPALSGRATVQRGNFLAPCKESMWNVR